VQHLRARRRRNSACRSQEGQVAPPRRKAAAAASSAAQEQGPRPADEAGTQRGAAARLGPAPPRPS
jgi:hypothetical protein